MMKTQNQITYHHHHHHHHHYQVAKHITPMISPVPLEDHPAALVQQ
jgi:hypothetical protein